MKSQNPKTQRENIKKHIVLNPSSRMQPNNRFAKKVMSSMQSPLRLEVVEWGYLCK